MSDDLHCTVCSELMFDPVVLTPCGHSFDRVCIKEWFKKSLRSCPSCRGAVRDESSNITLKNLVHEHAKNNNIHIPEPPPRERPIPSAPPPVPSAPPAVNTPSTIDLNRVLLYAAKHGNLQQLEFYISAGACVNTRDGDNRTPLHWAARKGSPNCVRLLLSEGACVDAKTIDNMTPLHYAAYNGSPECVRLLLAAGACVDTKTIDNWTPLRFAKFDGHIECAQILIQNGARSSKCSIM